MISLTQHNLCSLSQSFECGGSLVCVFELTLVQCMHAGLSFVTDAECDLFQMSVPLTWGPCFKLMQCMHAGLSLVTDAKRAECNTMSQ